MTQRIVFVGFGLLAASAAAAIRQSRGNAFKIAAVSSPATCSRALELNLADEVYPYEELEAAIPGADLVLLCGPILHILECLDQLAEMHIKSDLPILVSDIGSTKAAICRAGAKLPSPFLFVGGHPMAGSEKRSADNFDSSIYENAYWILCPPEGGKPSSWTLLGDIIDIVGAHPVTLPAPDHDRIMARLSHVPQMISTALAAGLSSRILENSQQHLAGRGFRDMTRIAASSWPMWRDIVKTNAAEISEGLVEYAETLSRVRTEVGRVNDPDCALQPIFERGNEVRTSLSATGKGFSQSLHEVMVHLADRPGSIVAVVTPLADAGINVLDIELAKVREGLSGQLLLGFKTLPEAEKTVSLLTAQGFQASVRS